MKFRGFFNVYRHRRGEDFEDPAFSHLHDEMVEYQPVPVGGGQGSLAWVLEKEHVIVYTAGLEIELAPDEVAAVRSFVQKFPQKGQ